jgi:hypothetical protein
MRVRRNRTDHAAEYRVDVNALANTGSRINADSPNDQPTHDLPLITHTRTIVLNTKHRTRVALRHDTDRSQRDARQIERSVFAHHRTIVPCALTHSRTHNIPTTVKQSVQACARTHNNNNNIITTAASAILFVALTDDHEMNIFFIGTDTHNDNTSHSHL